MGRRRTPSAAVPVHGPSLPRNGVTPASALNLTTVAEGIETAVQARLVEAFGCTQGQGYLFSRRLRPDALHDILLDRDGSATATASKRPSGHPTYEIPPHPTTHPDGDPRSASPGAHGYNQVTDRWGHAPGDDIWPLSADIGVALARDDTQTATDPDGTGRCGDV